MTKVWFLPISDAEAQPGDKKLNFNDDLLQKWRAIFIRMVPEGAPGALEMFKAVDA